MTEGKDLIKDYLVVVVIDHWEKKKDYNMLLRSMIPWAKRVMSRYD